VLVPPGSVLDARSPAAVAGGNVETSQRVVDLVFGALAPAAPARIPAASQGTMNNLAFGGLDPRDGRPFAYYETIAGGCGGGPLRSGLAGTHSHMTNSWNTPIEALEHDLPVRVRRYALRAGSGGRGLHGGGEGIAREIEFLAAAEVTLLTERRRIPPWGLAGGGPGERGRNLCVRADAGPEPLTGKCRLQVRAGDRVCVETPGGGGWGKPAPEEPGLP
jgi:N-methylhydantoinase B